jgi:hypothetical protein
MCSVALTLVRSVRLAAKSRARKIPVAASPRRKTGAKARERSQCVRAGPLAAQWSAWIDRRG